MIDDAAIMDDVLPTSAGMDASAAPGRFGRLVRMWRDGDFPGLERLSIRLRFALLMTFAMVGAVVFAGVYRMAENRIDTMLVAQDGYRRMNDLGGDVRSWATALQNHQEQFLRERDPAFADAFRRDAAQVSDNLKALAALSQAQGVAPQVGDLNTAFAAIPKQFDKVVALVDQLGLTGHTGLRGRLVSSAKAMEDELKMWPNAGVMMPDMLQMRQAEKNFMLYGGEEYINLHHKYSRQFDFDLDNVSFPNSTKEDFRKLLGSYSADMDAFAQGTLSLDGEVNTLRQQFQAVQPALNKVFTHAREGMTQAIHEQEQVRAGTSRLVAGFGLLAVVLFCAAALVLARSITQPVRLIEDAMDRLSKGDHTVAVPGISRRDEIGDMAKAVEIFKENSVAMVRMQREQEAIRAEAESVSRSRMLALADHFEQAVKSVADVVNQNAQAIHDTAEAMIHGGGHGLGNRALSVAEAAGQARQTVAAVAQAAGELAESVSDISAQVGAMSSIVREAVTQLARTDDRVRGLSQVAGDIDRVVNLINDIAHRTNMLSMNATIEAQRAGEAGKGFAVVANEVKHLAAQTSESTQEIVQQVASIQTATAETVAAIGDVGIAIRRMDEIAAQVAQAASRQADVTGKIGQCVDQVATDSRRVTDGVVDVTQSAARYCGSAVRVIWAAEDLALPAADLKQEVDGFLTTIRA